MAEDFGRRLQAQGLSLEQYMQFTGMKAQEFLDQMRPEALKRIKNSLVLEAIAAKEKFEILEEHVDAELDKMADMYKMEKDKVKELLGNTGLEQIKSDLSIQKAVDLLRDTAKETDKKEEENK